MLSTCPAALRSSAASSSPRALRKWDTSASSASNTRLTSHLPTSAKASAAASCSNSAARAADASPARSNSWSAMASPLPRARAYLALEKSQAAPPDSACTRAPCTSWPFAGRHPIHERAATCNRGHLSIGCTRDVMLRQASSSASKPETRPWYSSFAPCPLSRCTAESDSVLATSSALAWRRPLSWAFISEASAAPHSACENFSAATSSPMVRLVSTISSCIS
mmetsp:Transcript_82379/g.266794  ORF Transcript_82379/g.266794 Transcript_82379/m.266794 type:complete len:223 (+) Transcript_82379:214-882(+)